jgi:hypothetical protein
MCKYIGVQLHRSRVHVQIHQLHPNDDGQDLPAVCCGCSGLIMLNIRRSTGGGGRNGIPLHASHTGSLPPWPPRWRTGDTLGTAGGMQQGSEQLH